MPTTPALPVVTLAKVKICKFASEETTCFEADVLIDGVKVGTASNDGKGGCDNFYPWAIEKQLDDIAKAMPQIDKVYSLPNDAGMLMIHLLDVHEMTTKLKRDLKKWIMYVGGDGKIWQVKMISGLTPAQVPALTARLRDCKTILNFLPIAEAVSLYIEAMDKAMEERKVAEKAKARKQGLVIQP